MREKEDGIAGAVVYAHPIFDCFFDPLRLSLACRLLAVEPREDPGAGEEISQVEQGYQSQNRKQLGALAVGDANDENRQNQCESRYDQVGVDRAGLNPGRSSRRRQKLAQGAYFLWR